MDDEKASEVDIPAGILSKNGADLEGWMPAIVPGTVLNSLVHNKVYPEPYFGLNNKITSGLMKIVLPRKGHFDSDMTECGPPAVMTDNGILLIYNGRNRSGKDRDRRYTPNSYCAGQLLFDLNDPCKVIGRLDEPFFVPQEEFEKCGQYPHGTVFVEGLVLHKGKWHLYYGCADSLVGTAILEKEQ